jgi:propanol-preferring alcohol dehydrogenase
MTETMKAFRIVEWERPAVLTEAPIPTAGPGEILIEVAGNGLCHSDVGMAQMPAVFGEALGWSVPFTLGHEVGGFVADIGAGVTQFNPGDAVAVVSPHSCGNCGWCTNGWDNNCDDSLVGRGYGINGGLAKYVVVSSERELVRLHNVDPKIAGPLTDAGATSYHAVKRCAERIPENGHAVVIGAGGLGSFAVQHLRALTNAEVIAVDISPERLAYATELGAHQTFSGVHEGTAAEIRKHIGGGANAVLDFVGIDESISQGLALTERRGSFALIGAGHGKIRGELFSVLPRDGEVFSFQAPTLSDTHEVIALAEAGKLRVDVDFFSLDNVVEAYEKMEAGELRGRAVVIPD